MATTTIAADRSGEEQRALELVDRLAADEFEYVRHWFRADMQGASPTEFPEMWAQVTALFGEFEDAVVVEEPVCPDAADDVEAESVVHLAVTLQGGRFGAAVGFAESGLIADFAFGKEDGGNLVDSVRTALRAGRFIARKAVFGGLTRLRQRAPGRQTGPTTPADRREFAVSTVERLGDREFEAVVGTFTPGLREELPADRVRDTWESVVDEFDGIDAVEYEAAEEAAFVTVTTATKRIQCSVHFDEYGRVNGLQIRPASDGKRSDYETPAYVRECALIEREFAVGTDDGLDGLLAVPRGTGPFPAVVIVHGSGPGDKDGTVGANRPYRDIAQGLATRGVAALRYDKRTRHDETRSPEDRVVADAVDAVRSVRDDPAIDADRAFVLGHSLGGYLSPQIATRADADGLVALATPCTDFLDIVPNQVRLLAERDRTETTVDEATEMLDRVRAGDAAPDETVLGFPALFWETLAAYSPETRLRESQLPALVCHAGRDWRIPNRAVERWQTLADEGLVELHRFENCNHGFVEVSTDRDVLDAEKTTGHPTEELIATTVEFLERC